MSNEPERAMHSADILGGLCPDAGHMNHMPGHTYLAVGEKFLDGELEYHLGNYELAFKHLREAVRRDDDLEYTEPWAWMHPPRHALGALLAEQGHVAQAEELYRADLGLGDALQRCAQHPDNVWALHGFVECLRKRGDQEELHVFEAKLARALDMTDMPITSSCLCRTRTTDIQTSS